MDELRYWVGFNLIPHIGSTRQQALLSYFGDLASAWHASATALRAAGLPQAAIEQLLYGRQRLDLDVQMERIGALGLRLVTWRDPEYPPRLREIDQSPPLLYVRGELSPSDEWAVAVVGTRSPTTYGKDAAERLAGGLAENGVTVISGLALGIDGVAHRAALEAGGRSIAVLGSGLDVIYPARHEALAEEIAQHGVLLSDFPLGTKPAGGNFPARNRIISGLGLGTLVVEAGARSGALITLQFALDQGRETFAVPGSIHSRMSAGTNAAIQRGEAKLVMDVADILEELNLAVIVEQKEVRSALPENPTEASLMACMGGDPLHIDEIVRLSGLPTATVSSVLCLMELKGLVRRVENMSYIVSR